MLRVYLCSVLRTTWWSCGLHDSPSVMGDLILWIIRSGPRKGVHPRILCGNYAITYNGSAPSAGANQSFRFEFCNSTVGGSRKHSVLIFQFVDGRQLVAGAQCPPEIAPRRSVAMRLYGLADSGSGCFADGAVLMSSEMGGAGIRRLNAPAAFWSASDTHAE